MSKWQPVQHTVTAATSHNLNNLNLILSLNFNETSSLSHNLMARWITWRRRRWRGVFLREKASLEKGFSQSEAAAKRILADAKYSWGKQKKMSSELNDLLRHVLIHFLLDSVLCFSFQCYFSKIISRTNFPSNWKTAAWLLEIIIFLWPKFNHKLQCINTSDSIKTEFYWKLQIKLFTLQTSEFDRDRQVSDSTT